MTSLVVRLARAAGYQVRHDARGFAVLTSEEADALDDGLASSPNGARWSSEAAAWIAASEMALRHFERAA